MKYKWEIKKHGEIKKDFLEIALNSEIVAQLLLNRGINSIDKAKAYLDPNFYLESKPEEIPNLILARDRIIKAINEEEKITIFGDYDVDGVTATSCLLIALRQYTDNIDFYIPNRLTEGYGLNLEAVKKIAKKNKAKLLITCDCGITNTKEIELANSLGLDVIVTDHHSLPEILPPAYAVLNPKLLPKDHKLHFLPGVGVAYKLAESVIASPPKAGEAIPNNSRKNDRDCFVGSNEPPRNDITKEDLLDLVTLGMIADLAPLVDENRYLVQIGLPKLANTKKVGLQELLRICGCAKEDKNNPTTDHVGFGIAPRINAVGRLTNAADAVKLFTTDNLHEAIQIACELEAQNQKRQSICEETLKEAITLVSEQVDLKNDKCIVLSNENWHHGVIGIVASRILEKFNLPTILICIDKEENIARGSGRSSSALNIIEAVSMCSKHLEKFGGHSAACGLSVKPENLNNFIFNFKDVASNMIGNADLAPTLQIDLELPTSNLNLDLNNKINKLSPFGLGNQMPLFVSEEVEIIGVKNIGKDGKHLKLMLKGNAKVFEALIWNHDNNVRFEVQDKIKIAYTPKLNTYNGETFIQLEVKDIERTCETARRPASPAKRGERDGEEQRTIKLIDYRGQAEECLDLFSDAQVICFAEVLQKDFLPLKTYSRDKITKTENLVFLESPPDEITFLAIIKKSQASRLYLAFSNQQSGISNQYLEVFKKIMGMLRYVQNNKGSIVNEKDLQSALGLNKTTLIYALETLTKIGFLSYERKDVQLNINISNPSRQNFHELIEYNLFIFELKKIIEFKEWLTTANISEIAKMLERSKLLVKVMQKEMVGIL